MQPLWIQRPLNAYAQPPEYTRSLLPTWMHTRNLRSLLPTWMHTRNLLPTRIHTIPPAYSRLHTIPPTYSRLHTRNLLNTRGYSLYPEWDPGPVPANWSGCIWTNTTRTSPGCQSPPASFFFNTITSFWLLYPLLYTRLAWSDYKTYKSIYGYTKVRTKGGADSEGVV
jgi:hypothetical protein